jgi:hypothetical protein
MEYSTRTFVRLVTTAGIAIAIAFVSSALVFANSHYHTTQREGAWGVLAASSWLELLWAVAGSILAVARWRSTTLLFRIVLAINVAIAGFLIADFFWLH